MADWERSKIHNFRGAASGMLIAIFHKWVSAVEDWWPLSKCYGHGGNIGLLTLLCFIRIAFGDFDNRGNVRRNGYEEERTI